MSYKKIQKLLTIFSAILLKIHLKIILQILPELPSIITLPEEYQKKSLGVTLKEFLDS